MTQGDKIPRLYETENVPFEEKIIYQHYYLPFHKGFHWLIAELSPEEKLAFGYAHLNDPQNAEWGYISIRDLEEINAILDRSWKPCPFREARARLKL